MGKFTTPLIPFFLLFILSVFALQPLFQPGFFTMHDATQVERVFEMGQSLKDGMFPVRWVKDLGYGYGYPIFNFYAPLAYYVGGIFTLMGLEAVLSTKLMIGMGIMLAGVTMYVLAREVWGKLGGFISALFYLYAPYHAVDVYVRGAIGELWAYAFLPLFGWGIYKLVIVQAEGSKSSEFKAQSLKLQYMIQHYYQGVTITALGFAGIILSHNLTAVMLLPFLVCIGLVMAYLGYKYKNYFSLFAFSFALFIGVGLSAFYALPAVAEMNYTNVASQLKVGQGDFHTHFVCLEQLWESPWGYAGSASGCTDGLSFRVGKLHLLGSIVAFVAVFFLGKKEKQRYWTMVFSLLGLLISILLMLQISVPVWDLSKFFAYIQYPWRYLLFAAFFTSLLVGGIVWFLETLGKQKFIKYGGVVVLSGLVLFSYAKLFVPQALLLLTNQQLTSYEHIAWETTRLTDEYLPPQFNKPQSIEHIVKQRVDNQSLVVNKTQELVFTTTHTETQMVHLNLAPFPAWQVYIDGKDVSYTNTNTGINVSVPSGEHTVRVVYQQTFIQRLANVVSILSILILLMVYLRVVRRNFSDEEKKR